MPRRARMFGANWVTSSPPKTTAPLFGRSAPEMQLTSVVFPEPLGPISPKRSPLRISTLILSSATKPPKVLVSPSTRSSAPSLDGGVVIYDLPHGQEIGAEAR